MRRKTSCTICVPAAGRKRMGRKWEGRDRAVAKKVVAWYRDATGEHPVKK